MQIKYLVPTIINIFVKLMIYVLVFFLLLNVFAFMYNFPKLSAISKMVQDSVCKHGYLPYRDYLSIQAYIDAYQYQAKNAGSPLNINKIVTNLKIAVYDTDGQGRPDPNSGNFHSWQYDSENLFYIDANNNEEVKSRKKQQGSILFAGITCDYAILHPLNGWILVDVALNQQDGSQISNNISFSNPTGSNNNAYQGQTVDWSVNQSLDYSAGRKNGYTTFNTFNITNINNTSGSSVLNGALFIEPVLTDEYYADIENTETMDSLITY